MALEINQEGYSNEPVAKTVMAAKEADPALLAKIADASALARVEALAAAGYWYDALDLLGAADRGGRPLPAVARAARGPARQVGLQRSRRSIRRHGRSQ